jgi:rfaE bifunctional protein kinase chain/domain
MFRLVLQGVEDSSPHVRDRVTSALKSSCGFQVVELDELLSQGPVVITTSQDRSELITQYQALTSAGGKALIVRAKERTPSFEHVREVQHKMRTVGELALICERARMEGKRVVLVHGIFDLVHIGHIKLLNQAREHGELLVVTVVADAEVHRGPGNPFFKQELRVETLANLSVVDYVAVIPSESAVPAIEAFEPAVLVRGPRFENNNFDVRHEFHEAEELAMERVSGEVKVIESERIRTGELINRFFETYPHETTRYLKQFARKYTLDTIVQALEQVKNKRVLVIGDAIIDQYHYCSALGKSAKESIVVNKSVKEESYIGGSIATANHVAQLSGRTELLTVLGSNCSYEEFIRSKLDPAIVPHFIFRDNAPTTVKKRYVSKEQNAKLFEICDLEDEPLRESEEMQLAAFLSERIEEYDLVVVNDFGHGMITPRIMRLICARAKQLALNVQTNGANQGFNLVTNYERADFVCIDERELRLATREKFNEVPSLMLRIAEALQCKQIVATRGAEGSVSFSSESGFVQTPAFATSSVDKIGAGDAFFAYTAPCYAAGLPQDLIAFIGNCVGSLKVQIVGNKEQVKASSLIRFVDHLLKL